MFYLSKRSDRFGALEPTLTSEDGVPVLGPAASWRFNVRWTSSQPTCFAVAEFIRFIRFSRSTLRKQIDAVLAVEGYCQSQLGQDLLLKMTTGSAQGVLNTKSVAELPVPIPPLDERKEILQRLERLSTLSEKTDKLLRDAVSRAARLRQAILKRAFAGKLVPQDPNGEPASALLERIQVARKAEPKASPDRGRWKKEAQHVS